MGSTSPGRMAGGRSSWTEAAVHRGGQVEASYHRIEPPEQPMLGEDLT